MSRTQSIITSVFKKMNAVRTVLYVASIYI